MNKVLSECVLWTQAQPLRIPEPQIHEGTVKPSSGPRADVECVRTYSSWLPTPGYLHPEDCSLTETISTNLSSACILDAAVYVNPTYL